MKSLFILILLALTSCSKVTSFDVRVESDEDFTRVPHRTIEINEKGKMKTVSIDSIKNINYHTDKNGLSTLTFSRVDPGGVESTQFELILPKQDSTGEKTALKIGHRTQRNFYFNRETINQPFALSAVIKGVVDIEEHEKTCQTQASTTCTRLSDTQVRCVDEPASTYSCGTSTKRYYLEVQIILANEDYALHLNGSQRLY